MLKRKPNCRFTPRQRHAFGRMMEVARNKNRYADEWESNYLDTNGYRNVSIDDLCKEALVINRKGDIVWH